MGDVVNLPVRTEGAPLPPKAAILEMETGIVVDIQHDEVMIYASPTWDSTRDGLGAYSAILLADALREAAAIINGELTSW